MEYSTPELILYVREQLAAGFTRSALETTLAQAGWTPEAIEETFRLLVEQHKTSTPEPIIPEPLLSQEFSPEPTAESLAVSNQLDQLLAGSTQPLQIVQEPASVFSPAQVSQPVQAFQDPIPTQPVSSTQPIQEPFVDTPADQRILSQDNNSVIPTLSRDTETQNQIAYSIPSGASETIMSTEVTRALPKHHHWWQILILVMLIVITIALLLLVLHALNVYDALSIDTPVWADNILSWIQSLLAGKA